MNNASTYPLGFRRHRMLLGLLVSFALLMLAACNRPLVVDANGAGIELLALSGETKVAGTTNRTLRYGKVEIPKGARLRVIETWLLRKPGMSPPGYRVKGFYDPSVRSDGLVLPPRSVRVFFRCAVGPSYEKAFPIPQETFVLIP